MNSTSPTLDLTIVIPAFRAELTIANAVRSALEASARAVLVVDDGSDDSTAERARQAGATCIQQSNAGAAIARSNGAAHASTEYLAFLDADDELIPDAVRNSVRILTESKNLSVAAGTVIGIADGGVERPFPIRFSPVTTETLLINGHGPWPPCAAVIRRDSYEKSKQIDPLPLHPRFAEDYELLIRLSLVGDIDVRTEASCRYRLAGGKSVRSAINAIRSKEEIRQHYATYLGIDIDLMTARQISMAADVRQARAEWASGNKVQTAKYLMHWFRRDPLAAARKLSTKPWARN
ncbi:glycosyltransferase [Rhodococcus sp. HNM0563]|uniref:glycosyltransferase family 2 protein n=1 Tax=Rhodococcus sp. HNM0563 TaxID=2716339 RepID=UPI00146B47BE|nr:glycosyltransferase [Rhodococcus sp. HNM0563]NLU61683.1 glycosyltransferase [Rhodococcus sp. HNM0563]